MSNNPGNGRTTVPILNTSQLAYNHYHDYDSQIISKVDKAH
jgi:hypothetical protein